MTANLNPYSAYKNSGVPWLGHVPEHWEVLPALVVYKPKLVRNIGMIERTVLSLSYGRLIIKPEQRLRGLVPESFETYQIVEPGNTIIRTTDLQNDQTSLRVGYARSRGIITSAYMCLETTDRVSPQFGYQFLNVCDLLKIIYGFGSGLRQNLDFSHIKRMPVLVPPKEEQSAIVRFLDQADRHIQRYIRAKKKLISLLNERRQAIIHRAVTRGLDPNVRLKPSGVEWLGEVPEHWGVAQIRSIACIVRGSSPRPAGSPLYFHGTGMPWITVGEITRDSDVYLRSTATRLTSAGAEHSRTIEAGTLLLTNSGATLGIPKISLIQGCLNDGVAAFLRLRAGKEFVYFYLITQTTHLKAWVDLGAQPNLNTQIIGGWPVVLPPADEQDRIVDHIKRETAVVARAIAKANHELSLLREYRTRLIADVVTGKLDVREAAARLPKEDEEQEPLDEGEALAEDGEEGEGADLDAESEEVLT